MRVEYQVSSTPLRLIGIDTPERGELCFDESTEAMNGWWPNGPCGSTWTCQTGISSTGSSGTCSSQMGFSLTRRW